MGKLKTRKLKRVRSDSAGEAIDGQVEEIEQRYRKVVLNYLKSLKRSSLLSSDIYKYMLDMGVVDEIVDRKMANRDECIYDSWHEEYICSQYVALQTSIEKRETALVLHPRIKLTHYEHAPHPLKIEDLSKYICSFL
jgi:hypothetical protein